MFLAIAWFTAVQLVCTVVVFLLVLHFLRDITRPLVTRLIPIQRRMQNGFFQLQARLTIGTNLLLATLMASATYWGIGRVKAFFSQETAKEINSSSLFTMDYTDGSDTEEETLRIDETSTPAKSDLEAAPAQIAGRYVLQIGAFTAVHRAKRMQKRWTNQSEYRVYIVEMPYEKVQYKVLLGDFKSADEALTYMKQVRTSSFPRKYEADRMTELP